MESFRDDLTKEVKAILSSNFTINVVETKTVPTADDPGITYPNLRTMQQTSKLITTCVLHVDIRGSTDLGDTHRRPTLAKLYSAFARGMARCAEYNGGKVRNIIGDRVTIFFDVDNCFVNAVNTAILMNSFAQHVLNRWFTGSTIKCGIGIDYGSMLATKVGIIKYGMENTSHRDLVWLGRPANVASRLADIANKTETTSRDVVNEFIWYPFIRQDATHTVEMRDFLQKLQTTSSPNLVHPNQYFSSFWLSPESNIKTVPPILMTDSVYRGFRAAAPNDPAVTNSWFKRVGGIAIPNVNVPYYGGDVVFTAFQQKPAGSP